MARWIDKGSPAVIAALSLSALVMFELRAPEAPVPEALRYRGELRASDGLPIMGAHVIGVELWDAAQEGERLCTVSPQAIEVDHGQFSLALTQDCADAFRRGRDAWADLQVDGEHLSPRAQLVSPRARPSKVQDAPAPSLPEDAAPQPAAGGDQVRQDPAEIDAPLHAEEPRESILCI